MKKYMIFAAVAALTLASCAKVETISNTMEEETPIGFSNYTPRSITKAGSTYTSTADLPDNAVMGVYGYSTASGARFQGTENPTFITNGMVDFGSSLGNSPTTTSGEKKYWPKDIRNLLTFYAYYPYAADNTGVITEKPTSTTSGLGNFHVAQTADVTTMVDFMISDVQNDMYYWDGTNVSSNSYGQKSTTSGSTYGIVPLQLRHMLSNVNFYFKTNITETNTYIKIKEASIAGIKSQAAVALSYTAPTTAGDQGSTDFEVSAVTSSEYASAITIPIASTIDTDNNTEPDTDVNYIKLTTTAAINYVDLAGTITKNNFLFVPQTLTNDAKVTIKYDLIQGETSTENVVEVKIKGTANDANNAIVKWEYNNKYNYIFTIGLHEIYFTGDPVAWTNGDDANITVN